jgi:hypothetical protein
MQLELDDSHGAKLECFLELLNICKVSHHVAQSHKENLQFFANASKFQLFFVLSLFQFLLVFDSLRRQFELSSFLEIFYIDVLLLTLADLLYTFSSVNQVINKQNRILQVNFIKFLVLLFTFCLR